jgi:hypothetical protein
MHVTTLPSAPAAIKTVRDPGDPPPIREETDLSPDAVQARVVDYARRHASATGGFSAPHAVNAWREAYRKLWARQQAQCPDQAFWPARI